MVLFSRLCAVFVVTTCLPVHAAEPERCQLRSDIRPGGFTDPALECAGERLRGIAVQWQRDGTITGISWRDYEDAEHGRVTRVLSSGEIHFGAIDDTKGTKWSQSYRGLSVFVFAQPTPMLVERVDEERFIVHDGTGTSWHLERSPSPKYSWNFSYRITAINDAPQSPLPVGFAEANIIGVDLKRPGLFHLVARSHSYAPYAKTHAPAWSRTKSHIFDPAKKRCVVANRELFRVESDDEYEAFFRFADDLDGFVRLLAQRCSKLDRSRLEAIELPETRQIETQPSPAGGIPLPHAKSPGPPRPMPGLQPEPVPDPPPGRKE